MKSAYELAMERLAKSDPQASRPLTPEQEAYYGVKYSPMDELLRESDVVVSFVPGIPEAAKMMGAAQFALMKPGETLIQVDAPAPAPVQRRPGASPGRGHVGPRGPSVTREEERER